MPVIFYFFLTPCLVKPVSTARENKEGGNLIAWRICMFISQNVWAHAVVLVPSSHTKVILAT